MKYVCAILLAGLLALGSVGCANFNRTQNSALIGGVGGALVGTGVSLCAGGPVLIGTFVGGGLGTLAGGIYGNYLESGGW